MDKAPPVRLHSTSHYFLEEIRTEREARALAKLASDRGTPGAIGVAALGS
jgi:hypothetical protein